MRQRFKDEERATARRAMRNLGPTSLRHLFGRPRMKDSSRIPRRRLPRVGDPIGPRRPRCCSRPAADNANAHRPDDGFQRRNQHRILEARHFERHEDAPRSTGRSFRRGRATKGKHRAQRGHKQRPSNKVQNTVRRCPRPIHRNIQL